MASNMNIWRHVLLWVIKNPMFYLLNPLGYKKYNVRKKFSLTINAFIWKKLLLEKEHKNMCIQVLNLHTNACDIRKLPNPFNWFYNTLVKLVLQYSKGYEFFWLAIYQFIHWLKLFSITPMTTLSLSVSATTLCNIWCFSLYSYDMLRLH